MKIIQYWRTVVPITAALITLLWCSNIKVCRSKSEFELYRLLLPIVDMLHFENWNFLSDTQILAQRFASKNNQGGCKLAYIIVKNRPTVSR